MTHQTTCGTCKRPLCKDINKWEPDTCHTPHGGPHGHQDEKPEPTDKEEWEKIFRERFSVASFTWNGEVKDGRDLAEKTREEVATLIRQVESQAFERGREEAEHVNYDTMVQHINNAAAQGRLEGLRMAEEKKCPRECCKEL